tara:strand:- start:646 stop:984 length:339 start_codon:yes stop_codon:yes gene_type:complete
MVVHKKNTNKKKLKKYTKKSILRNKYTKKNLGKKTNKKTNIKTNKKTNKKTYKKTYKKRIQYGCKKNLRGGSAGGLIFSDAINNVESSLMGTYNQFMGNDPETNPSGNNSLL